MNKDTRNIVLTFGSIALVISLLRGQYQRLVFASEMDEIKSVNSKYHEQIEMQQEHITQLEKEKEHILGDLSTLREKQSASSQTHPIVAQQVHNTPIAQLDTESLPVVITQPELPVEQKLQTTVRKTRRTHAS